MSRKRRPEPKDHAEQYRRLKAAVAEILRERGYDELSAELISTYAEISRRTINRNFESLDELLRRCFRDFDFWMPRLEGVKVPASPRSSDTLRLFITMMQEQFRRFLSNQELRQLILAQMSKPDHLMKTMNALREAEGNRVIAMAEPHFEGSGIDIYWVIGLLLGGCYLHGLQGCTGNGPVCNRDANSSRDLEIGLRTIGQILEAVWWTADRAKRNKLPGRFFELSRKPGS